MKQKKIFFKKVISLVTTLIFLSSDTGWTLSQISVLSSSRETPSHFEIDISPQLARVDDFYQAPSAGKPAPLFFHIQTAHGHYPTQRAIVALLENLREHYGIQALFLEGAVEELDKKHFAIFDEQEKNTKIADYLAQQGQLPGGDLFVVEDQHAMPAFGIENAPLYRKNYNALRAVWGTENETKLLLEKCQIWLETLLTQAFPKKSLSLFREYARFAQGHRGFIPYVQNLTRESLKILGIDFARVISQKQWPFITRLLTSQTLEKKIEIRAALQEKEQIITFMKKVRLDSSLIKALEDFQIRAVPSSNRVKGFKDLRSFMEVLADAATPKGFAFSKYPSFSLYAGYRILLDEQNPQELFKELERLFTVLLDSLAKTDQEQGLLDLYRRLQFFQNLYRLELSREEWEKAAKDIKPEDLAVWIKDLEQLKQDMNSAEKSPSVLSAPEIEKLKTTFEQAIAFYRFAAEREKGFEAPIQAEMEKRHIERAAVITGGFHTDAMTRFFRANHFSYIALSPTAQGEFQNARNLYQNAMLGPSASHPDSGTMEIASFVMPVKKQESLGVRSELRARAIVNAIVETRLLPDTKTAATYVRQAIAARESTNLNVSFLRSELRKLGESTSRTDTGNIPLNRARGLESAESRARLAADQAEKPQESSADEITGEINWVMAEYGKREKFINGNIQTGFEELLGLLRQQKELIDRLPPNSPETRPFRLKLILQQGMLYEKLAKHLPDGDQQRDLFFDAARKYREAYDYLDLLAETQTILTRNIEIQMQLAQWHKRHFNKSSDPEKMERRTLYHFYDAMFFLSEAQQRLGPKRTVSLENQLRSLEPDILNFEHVKGSAFFRFHLVKAFFLLWFGRFNYPGFRSLVMKYQHIPGIRRILAGISSSANVSGAMSELIAAEKLEALSPNPDDIKVIAFRQTFPPWLEPQPPRAEIDLVVRVRNPDGKVFRKAGIYLIEVKSTHHNSFDEWATDSKTIESFPDVAARHLEVSSYLESHLGFPIAGQLLVVSGKNLPEEMRQETFHGFPVLTIKGAESRNSSQPVRLPPLDNVIHWLKDYYDLLSVLRIPFPESEPTSVTTETQSPASASSESAGNKPAQPAVALPLPAPQTSASPTPPAPKSPRPISKSRLLTLRQLAEREIFRALVQHEGHLEKTAEQLQINVMTVLDHLKNYTAFIGVTPPDLFLFAIEALRTRYQDFSFGPVAPFWKTAEAHVATVLEASGFSMTEAAKRFRIQEDTLREKLNGWRIQRAAIQPSLPENPPKRWQLSSHANEAFLNGKFVDAVAHYEAEVARKRQESARQNVIHSLKNLLIEIQQNADQNQTQNENLSLSLALVIREAKQQQWEHAATELMHFAEQGTFSELQRKQISSILKAMRSFIPQQDPVQTVTTLSPRSINEEILTHLTTYTPRTIIPESAMPSAPAANLAADRLTPPAEQALPSPTQTAVPNIPSLEPPSSLLPLETLELPDSSNLNTKEKIYAAFKKLLQAKDPAQIILSLDITELVNCDLGRLKFNFPTPLMTGLSKAQTFGGTHDLKTVILTSVEKRKDGTIFLHLAYKTRSGESDTAVIFWDNDHYGRRGSEAEDQIYSAFGLLTPSDAKPQQIEMRDLDILHLMRFEEYGFLLGGKFPTPLMEKLGGSMKSIEIPPDASGIKLKWISKNKQGQIKLCLSYTRKNGEAGTSVLRWDGKGYVFSGKEEENAIYTAFEDLQMAAMSVRRITMGINISKLIYLTTGELGKRFPTPLLKPLSTHSSGFRGKGRGKEEPLKSVTLDWIEQRADGKIYLSLSYEFESREKDNRVIYWDENVQDYQVRGNKEQDAIYSLFEKLLSLSGGPSKVFMDLDVSGLINLKEGFLKEAFPTPLMRSLITQHLGFGAYENLRSVKLNWGELRKDGKIYLCLSYASSSGEEDTSVIVWEENTYKYKGSEEEDALRTAFETASQSGNTLDADIDLTNANSKFVSLETASLGTRFLNPKGERIKTVKPLGLPWNLRSLKIKQIKLLSDGSTVVFLTFQDAEGQSGTKAIVWDPIREDYETGDALMDSHLENRQFAEMLSSLGDDPDMVLAYLMLDTEFDSDNAIALVRESVAGLSGVSADVPDIEGFEATPSKVILTSTHVATNEPTYLVEGRVEGSAKQVVLFGDRERLVPVNPNGTFQTRVILKAGENVRIDLAPIDLDAKTRGNTTTVTLEQTSEEEDSDEVLARLLSKKKGLLDAIKNDTFRAGYLQQKLEVSLLKHFTENEDDGFKVLENRLANTPQAVREFYEKILKKFREVHAMEFPNFRTEAEGETQRIYFFQKYALYEILERMKPQANGTPRFPGAILALEPGLGKTLVALLLAHRRPESGALVVAPNSLTYNLEREEWKFMQEQRMIVAVGTSDLKTQTLQAAPHQTIRAVNVEYLRPGNPAEQKKRLGVLNQHPDQILILDESQFLKNTHTRQTQTAHQLKGSFRLLVSATPVSDPLSVRPILQALTGDVAFSNTALFEKTMIKDESLDSLRKLHFMLYPYMIRIKIKHVFKKYDRRKPLAEQKDRLPDQRWIDPEKMGSFEYTPDQAVSTRDLLFDWRVWRQNKLAFLSRDLRTDTIDDRENRSSNPGDDSWLAKTHALKELTNDPLIGGIGLPKPGKETSPFEKPPFDERSPKAKEMKRIVHHEVVELNGKVVMMTPYKQQVKNYAELFAELGVVTYYGDTGLGETDSDGYLWDASKNQLKHFQVKGSGFALSAQGRPFEAEDYESGRPMTALEYNRLCFQHDPSVRVLIATDETGGVGATLTAANAMIFDGPSRHHDQRYQAGGRICRIDNQNKKYEVRYYQLCATYPKAFLENMKGVSVAVDRRTGKAEYFSREEKTGTKTTRWDEVKNSKRFRVYNLEEIFSQGTYDEIQLRNLERQRRIFEIVNDGLQSRDDLDLMTQSRLRDALPMLYDRLESSEAPISFEELSSTEQTLVRQRREQELPLSLVSALGGDFENERLAAILRKVRENIYTSRQDVKNEIQTREALYLPSDADSLMLPGTDYFDPWLAAAAQKYEVSLPPYPKEHLKAMTQLRKWRSLGFLTNKNSLRDGYYRNTDLLGNIKRLKINPYPMPSDVITELKNRKNLQYPSDETSLTENHMSRFYDPVLAKAAKRFGIPLDTPEEAAAMKALSPLPGFRKIYPTRASVEAARDLRYQKGKTFKGSSLKYDFGVDEFRDGVLFQAAQFHGVPFDPEEKYSTLSEINVEINRRTEKKILSTQAALQHGPHSDIVLLYQMEQKGMSWALAPVSKAGQVPAHLKGKSLQELELLSAHRVLGVRAGATPEEIKRRFNDQVRKYHPDQGKAQLDDLKITPEEATQRYESMITAKDMLLGETKTARTSKKLFTLAVRRRINGHGKAIITLLDGFHFKPESDRTGEMRRFIPYNHQDALTGIAKILDFQPEEIRPMMPIIMDALERPVKRKGHYAFGWKPEPLAALTDLSSAAEINLGFNGKKLEREKDLAARSELRIQDSTTAALSEVSKTKTQHPLLKTVRLSPHEIPFDFNSPEHQFKIALIAAMSLEHSSSTSFNMSDTATILLGWADLFKLGRYLPSTSADRLSEKALSFSRTYEKLRSLTIQRWPTVSPEAFEAASRSIREAFEQFSLSFTELDKVFREIDLSPETAPWIAEYVSADHQKQFETALKDYRRHLQKTRDVLADRALLLKGQADPNATSSYAALAQELQKQDQTGLRITYTRQAAAARIPISLTRLFSLVNNLVANALKHSPETSTVRLSFKTDKDDLVIRVQNPSMLDPSVTRNLFDLKTREDRIHIGLAEIWETLRIASGTIQIWSNPQKTVFTIRIPLKKPSAEEAASASARTLPETISATQPKGKVDQEALPALTAASAQGLQIQPSVSRSELRVGKIQASQWLPAWPLRLKQRATGLFVSGLLFLAISLQTVSAVTLAWDPILEPWVAGYAVRYGLTSGLYTTRVDVKTSTLCTLTNLTPGVTYYFVANAYTADGQENPPSPELAYTIPTGPVTNNAPKIPKPAKSLRPIGARSELREAKPEILSSQVQMPIASAPRETTLITGKDTPNNSFIIPAATKTAVKPITGQENRVITPSVGIPVQDLNLISDDLRKPEIGFYPDLKTLQASEATFGFDKNTLQQAEEAGIRSEIRIALVASRFARVTDFSTLREMITLLRPKQTLWKSKLETTLPVSNGIGAVVSLRNNLPSQEEILGLRAALRNPNHFETLIVVTTPESKSSIEKQIVDFRETESNWGKSHGFDYSNRLRVFVVSSAKELRTLSKTHAQELLAQIHKTANATRLPFRLEEYFVLAGQPELLKLLDADTLSARMIETQDWDRSEIRLAQQVTLAEVADAMAADPLSEKTNHYLIRSGRRYKLQENALRSFAKQIYAQILAAFSLAQAA